MAEPDADLLRRFLALAAARLEEGRGRLCALDGEVGDGDHGTSMANGFAAAAAAAREPRDAPPGPLLRAAAAAFLSEVGATVGPLYAGALGEAARLYDGPAAGEMGDGAGLARLIAAFGQGIAARGQARQGDKTMLDAWLPAAHAAREAAALGAAPAEVAARALAAARAGEAATATLIALRGRARRLGERGLGHVDPGAASAVLVLEALAEAVAGGPPA